MSPDPDSLETDVGSSDSESLDAEPEVLLFMRPGRDRELLVETLGERYRTKTSTDVEAFDSTFDCCVFDVPEFNRVAGTIQSKRDTANPVFLPFVLLHGESSGADTVETWEFVDDLIELPTDRKALLARIGNLVERRRTAAKLAEREAQLRETVRDLKLKEQAMDEAPIGITITDDGDTDNPLVYVNEQFQEQTGFDSDVLGDDCRFLQGEETDPETVATIRDAIEREQSVSVDVLNYRKTGEKFWNKLDVAPIHDGDEVTNFVGFQTDVTDRKIRERRLEVLNRVLSHNLRNKMNVIEGYVTLLTSEYDDGDPPEALREIERATADLLGLAESVQVIERTLDASDTAAAAVRVCERIEQTVGALEERFPEARFEVHVPDDSPCEVSVVGLMSAIEEALENAVKHNPASNPWVSVSVTQRADGWVDVEIVDDGPGIPDQELAVLETGETPLQHADRLGIWLMYWLVNKAGGKFSVDGAEQGGTRVRFSLPPDRQG